jgi:hypothetical protein
MADSNSITDFSFDTSVYDPSQVFTVPDISADIGNQWSLQPSGYLDNTPLNFSTSDLLGGAPLPSLGSALPSSAPSTMVYNPATGGNDTGMSTQDWLTTINKLANLGVQTYATVNQIDAGNGALYALHPSTGAVVPVAAPVDASADAPFAFADLYDFSKPWPYVIGGMVLAGLALIPSSKKK